MALKISPERRLLNAGGAPGVRVAGRVRRTARSPLRSKVRTGGYWRNGGDTPVVIPLKTSGFYQDLFEPPAQ